MGKRKWIPVSEEKVIETERCRYVLGLYDHQEYGRNCFRISKYIRDNDFFVGHFVVVLEDQESVLPEIAEYVENVVQGLACSSMTRIQPANASRSYWNPPLPRKQEDVSS